MKSIKVAQDTSEYPVQVRVAHCTGHGQIQCALKGYHSPYNHTLDWFYANPVNPLNGAK